MGTKMTVFKRHTLGYKNCGAHNHWSRLRSGLPLSPWGLAVGCSAQTYLEGGQLLFCRQDLG